ncbi:MAG: hypothetical protein WCS03_03935 [Bacteroidota bacterium]
MKFKQQLSTFILLLAIVSAFNDLFSQNIKPKPSRQSSFEAFSKENYEQAYNEFSELLLIYSKDPLYNYYSGVCLIKLNRNPDKAVILLEQSLQGASAVKALPSDANFYLGRALQMSGKFREAVESYTLFTEKVGKKAARESGVPEFIQQCNEKKGEIEETDIKPVVKEAVMQPVEKDISPKITLPVSYEKLLDQGLEFQFFADSLNSLVAQQKKDLEKLPNAEKSALKMNISENELAAVSFQKSADQKFSEAHIVMNPLQGKTGKADTVQQSDNKVIKDSVRQSGNEVVKKIDKQSDTLKKTVPMVIKPVEIFALFEVLPIPVSDPKVKIMIDPEAPSGLIYRIQTGVFHNPIPPSYFKGISPVYGFRIAGTDNTTYYAGMFRKYADANKALLAVRAKGFKDAFVVAFSGYKTVSSEKAAIMEKEWGMKPFMSLAKANILPETTIDSIPPTLTFRVEIVRSLKPLKDDVIEGIKKIAGSRGLDIQPLDDGNIVYLIGKFITFESAAEYVDLLIRNGYSLARVVAFLGKKEIPVETAKQLFDNLK